MLPSYTGDAKTASAATNRNRSQEGRGTIPFSWIKESSIVPIFTEADCKLP